MRFWRSLSGSQRLWVGGGAVAVVAWLAWPYLKMGSHDRQLRRMDVPRMVDPFGLLPRGEGDYAEALGRRLRLPPEAAYGGRDGLPRDRQGRPYRRWRECTGSRQHPHCGPWQYGPAPGEE